MVYDTLSNFPKYISLHSHFAEVNKFLNSSIFELPCGKYKINEKGSEATISEYETKELSSNFIEHHKMYIDIQIILKGREKFGFCNISKCKSLSFDTEKDFGKLEGRVNLLDLDGENFVIVFPQDGHMPKVCFENVPEWVRKMVIKVPVE